MSMGGFWILAFLAFPLRNVQIFIVLWSVESEMPLNVDLLEKSFELVKPKADEFVASFYDNLFVDYPISKPLFENSNMLKQQQMLKGSLVMIIENLRKPEALSNSLQGLGARHVKYGTLPEHYPLVGNSLIKTLQQYAGSAWTPELEEAWVDAYGAIAEIMLEGAEYAKEEIALESVAPVTAAASASEESSDEDDALNVELLEKSFELIKPKADEFTSSFYNNLFTDYPAAKPLFTHSDMGKQQQMLKGALVMVIENLRKPDVLSKSLKGLGARHVKYGVLPEHYPLVGNSLIKTLAQYAGAAWTPELKEAWVGAYDAITALMLSGADYAPQEVQLDPPEKLSGLASSVSVPEAPKGISGATAATIVGGGTVALIVLLIILL